MYLRVITYINKIVVAINADDPCFLYICFSFVVEALADGSPQHLGGPDTFMKNVSVPLTEDPKKNISTTEHVSTDSNVAPATDLYAEEIVNHSNNSDNVVVTKGIIITNQFDLRVVEDANNNLTEGDPSSQHETEGKVVGKSSEILVILENQNQGQDDQESTTNNGSMTVENCLDQKQCDKTLTKIELPHLTEDTTDSEHEDEESSHCPASLSGGFSPCFPEVSKDYESCNVTHNHITISCQAYLRLYVRDYIKFPAKCSEESKFKLSEVSDSRN